MKKLFKLLSLPCVILLATFTSCSTNNEETQEIDLNKIKDQNVIKITSDFNNYEITFGENTSSFSFRKNTEVLKWSWSEDVPLQVSKANFSDNNSLYLSASHNNMRFNYKIRDMKITSDNTMSVTQIMDDGTLNKHSIEVPFKINEIDTNLLVGEHLLNDGYVNSKIISKCPPCWIVVVFLTVVGDSDERKDDNCAENNRAVERNCMNRENKCLENHGPCDLRCVSCK